MTDFFSLVVVLIFSQSDVSVNILCFHLQVKILVFGLKWYRWSQDPKMETSSVEWEQASTLFTRGPRYSLIFQIKIKTMHNVKKLIIVLIYHRHQLLDLICKTWEIIRILIQTINVWKRIPVPWDKKQARCSKMVKYPFKLFFLFVILTPVLNL
jgi:hypothetical protein